MSAVPGPGDVGSVDGTIEPAGPSGSAADADTATTADRGGPLTSSLAWATWALFVGLGLMLSGAGLFATITGIRAENERFPTVLIGLITAAYYLGFLAGSLPHPVLLSTVGHIRVYAALASLLAVAMLTAGMLVTPVAWIGCGSWRAAASPGSSWWPSRG